MEKLVYSFHEGRKELKHLLGGKGANLGEMTHIGLPVPSGFTITTQACIAYGTGDRTLSPALMEEISAHLAQVESRLEKGFGNPENPLLFSVRSGAVFSMPGMMDTILNLGLNDQTVEGLAALTGNPRFAYDSYRRFIQMFADVAMGIPKVRFESLLEDIKLEKSYEKDTDLTADDLKSLVKGYKTAYLQAKGAPFPQDVMTQLTLAIEAVFTSWDNPRAVTYRNLNDIPHDLGTAVNVQAMVFGNMGDTSGTGVAFTRNPADGENRLFGEFLMNAQGEDVVAGIRTPQSIETLADILPDTYQTFVDTANLLERHYRDMQDIEFTIQQGKLYILQTRSGKRTAKAAIQVAVDMVESGLITKEEAVMRVEPKQLDQLLHPSFDPEILAETPHLTAGLPASPGAASGRIYFNAADVQTASQNGIDGILVRQETSPEDIQGMITAQGVLTARGGMTSHAAVVARGMGRCCVAGCQSIQVDETAKTLTIGDILLHEGDSLSLDGTTGLVYAGLLPKSKPRLEGSFATFMGYVDELRQLEVWANADTPRDAQVAVDLGAQGIGLCRTEHMFFETKRIAKIRQMIVAQDIPARQAALDDLLIMQRDDFEGIFRVMGHHPVTIRLLDPPLHEFLPQEDGDLQQLAQDLNRPLSDMIAIVESLKEVNPMLGHRGCRLAVTFPEIYQMQAQAILEAACTLHREGIAVKPEIMIPLVGGVKELSFVKTSITATIQETLAREGMDIPYTIGTMIEVPRAALLADEIAQDAAFFSFGTNDLTQMTFGYSRDDAGKFLHAYQAHGILEKSPFEVLDIRGVGRLMDIATALARQTRPDIKLGICGEHGGDPASVAFCHQLGLTYVSCSPYRVPVARLAAAQAALTQAEE